MKIYITVLIFILALACSKDNDEVCYICTTTYIETTDVPVQGYPLVTPFESRLCDVTESQVEEFEQTNRGSEVVIYNNITYTTSHTTDCQLE